MSQNSRDRRPLSSQAKSQGSSGAQAKAPQNGEIRPFTTSMDENANRLMDQVFGDIEKMLERGAQLQLEISDTPEPSPQPLNKLESLDSNSATPPQSTVDPATSSSLALLPKLSPRQLAPVEEGIVEESQDDTDLFFQLTQETKPQPEANSSRDKLMMAIAFVSLLIASGLWVFVRYSLSKAPATANVPSATEVLQAKQNNEFLNYVQRSMERIDRISKQAEANEAESNIAPPSALDPLYVPLPPPPALASAPTVPSPTARITISPLPPIATAPVTPAPAPATTAPSTAVTIPNIAPSPSHALIGLLELGDRSAALFEINGAPQRIQVGEQIGASGWALVSISGEEAIVRRNGEVRSIYIGQTF